MKRNNRRFQQLSLWPALWPAEPAEKEEVGRHVESGRNLFKRFQFSRHGIPPGTAQKILNNPERFWRKIEKGGKVFYEPLNELKKIHKRFATYFSSRSYQQYSVEPFIGVEAATAAYERGCSIVINGNRHRHNRSSLSLDMRNAFESIKTKHLYRFLFRRGVLFSLGMRHG
jgi:hypothetical protein